MICDLSTVLNNDGAVLNVAGGVDVRSMTDGLGVTFTNSVDVTGEIVCRSEVLALSAHVEGTAETYCARCLRELTVPLSFDFTETLVQDGKTVDNKDSVVVFSGTTVDLSELVVSNILLNLSYKYLCSNDCRGICPKCGADLNCGQCACEDDDIDPRWEKLKLFK